MQKELSIEAFRELLPLICDQDISSDPDKWTDNNPLYGTCAVVSLVAQNLFGGNLLRSSLELIKGFEHLRSHYRNQLPDGRILDFTASQFGPHYPGDKLLNEIIRERSYVLSFSETMGRYKLLCWRLAKKLYPDNPLFTDPIYQKCFFAALDSPCQKMQFGCVVVHKGEVVYEDCNRTIEPLKSLCDPTCIRLSIKSRTESMLGACGHAEELALWEMVGTKIPLNECDFYVAGLHSNGLPWIKEKAVHTCLRCAVQLYHAQVKGIYVPVINRWVRITPEEAVKTAVAYAQGKSL